METLIKEHEVFVKKGGIFKNPKGFLEVKGSEAKDFLHRITSQDIKELKENEAKGAALLNSDGTLISLFEIYFLNHAYLIVTDLHLKEKTLSALEKIHFSEDLTITDLTEKMAFLSLQGPSAKNLKGTTKVGHVVDHSDFGDENHGAHFFVKTEDAENVIGGLQCPVLSVDLWRLLRVEAGRVSFGDLSEKNIVLEAPLDGYVSRNKGCYPGQEVVERIFTYGNISKKIVGLHLTDQPKHQDGRQKLFSGADDAGMLINSVFIPWSKKVLGFGLVRKPFYENGQKLKVENSAIEAEVNILPHTFPIQKRTSMGS